MMNQKNHAVLVVILNDESKESYSTGSGIKFKTTMLIFVIMLTHTYLLKEQ